MESRFDDFKVFLGFHSLGKYVFRGTVCHLKITGFYFRSKN